MTFPFEKALLQLNREIEKLPASNHPKELYEPIRYILTLGGKRLRPMLTLIGSHIYSDQFISAIKPALAVEVFHNFSLIHDDIMDKAPLRRGQPTVHQKWNTNTAILAGDVALVEAYELLGTLPLPIFHTCFTLFNRCAREVCEGQQIDMNYEIRESVTILEYMEMIRLKTAVLLGFSLQLGALIGGASEGEADRLRNFGQNIGLAFQVMDDLLDVYGDSDKVGKQACGDILAHKKTFLLVKAFEKANSMQKAELESCFSETGLSDDQKIKRVLSVYEALTIKHDTEVEIKKLYNAAFAELNGLTCGPYRIAFLKQFAQNLIHRVS